MEFCYVCTSCGATGASLSNEKVGAACPVCPEGTLRRDWKAEGVGIGPGVRESNQELSASGYRELFLPSEDDLSSADDPTGVKGMKEWMDEHEPREGNKHPVLPERTKTNFYI
jgi:predicted RNA-binding Zn-ribbon protein involved in translation (DUF1610 family)